MHYSGTRLAPGLAQTLEELPCGVPAQLAATWRSRVLNARYRLTEPVGAGSSGIVFAADDLLSDKRVAVKLLLAQPHLSFSVPRLLLEAEIGHDLRHPNLVSLSDVGEDGKGTIFLVMELLQGMTLAQLLKERGPLNVTTTLAIILPIIQAVAHVHECGVLHRDIKPDNLFLSTCGQGLMTPKLIDFGIAKRTEELSHTRAGAVLGTPAYMSPEQALAEPLTSATDVWSLGVVLFECLTGRLPFEGASATSLLLKVVSSDAPSLSVLAPELPHEISSTVDRALSRSPATRFATARALGSALANASQRLLPSAHERPSSGLGQVGREAVGLPAMVAKTQAIGVLT